MWASILVLENFNILGLAGTSVEDRGSDIRHVLAESSVFVLDLVSEFTGVAKDNNADLASDGLDLLKRSNNEDGSFTCMARTECQIDRCWREGRDWNGYSPIPDLAWQRTSIPRIA
jgi:hypothetical protein